MLPNAFIRFLETYVDAMCVTYGYCISPSEKDRLLRDLKWDGPERFLRDFMVVEGLSPSEQPEHYQEMLRELNRRHAEWASGKHEA